jgi:hypothetical protein
MSICVETMDKIRIYSVILKLKVKVQYKAVFYVAVVYILSQHVPFVKRINLVLKRFVYVLFVRAHYGVWELASYSMTE